MVRGGNANYGIPTAGDSIYTITMDIPEGNIEYKYVIVRGDGWENIANNRTFAVPATGPVTIPAVYFNDVSQFSDFDIEVFFRVNMNVQILNGSFSAANDWVVVRGGCAELGSWGGAVARLTEETGNPGVYSAWIQINNVTPGNNIEYKFVYLIGGNPASETSRWEQLATNRVLTPSGQEPDLLPPPTGNGYHEIAPGEVYYSNVTPADVITRPLDVYVPFDMRPAYAKLTTPGEYIIDVQSGDTVRQITEVDLAGFFNNWPWGQFATSDLAFDGGANGDLVAGDTIWTAHHLFPAGSARAFEFKGGINGYDVEGGVGTNHVEQLSDAASSYRVPVLCFGGQGTLYTNWLNRCLSTGVWMEDPEVPSVFALSQNYPNPFNPSTTIRFSIPNTSNVRLEVFDVTGRRIAGQDLGLKNAGSYSLTFDGTPFSSGTYFYKISAGSNFAVRQMLLMK